MRRRGSSDVPRAPWPEQRHTHTQRRAVSADLQPVRARTDGRALLRADATHLAVAGIVKSRRDGEGRRDSLNIPSRGILVDGLV